MGIFKIKAKNRLQDMNIGDHLNESDFCTLTPEGTFVQMEYVDEDVEVKKMDVKPGIWTIQKSMGGLYLEKTAFVNDRILDTYVNTQEITTRIDKFFSKIDVYKKYGFAVAKRGILLYGPAGTGKSVSINKTATRYGTDGKTLVLIWNTDKYEAHHVKDFIKSFNYIDVDRMILVAEDIGGTEIDQSRMRSDSSLLSLLDNQEQTFTKPILILATTNYPENFMGNLTNRPNRFDDKIKVGYPEAEARAALLKFFDDSFVTQEDIEFFKHKKFEKFSPAHIREVIVRSAIYDKTIQESIGEIYKEIQNYEKAFTESSKLGL